MSRRASLSLAALTALAAFVCAPAAASVNMDSGSVRLSHVDLLLHDGSMNFKIEPIYHSTSTFRGIFGFGWESQYEEYLQLLHDGIVVYEYGGGAQNLFTQNGDPSVMDKTTFDQLQYDEALLGNVGSDADLRQIHDYIEREHAASRESELYRMVTYGFDLFQAAPAIGTQYVSRRFQTVEKLTRRIDGYERVFSADEGLPNETYSLDGRLRRLWSGSDYLAFSYDRAGRMIGVDDAAHDSLRFAYKNGRLARISGPHAKTVSYVQSPDGNLLSATGSDGTYWQFAYDANFNLTSLKKNRKLVETIAYNNDGTAKRIARADGTTIDYNWSSMGAVVDLRRKDGTTVRGVYDSAGHLVKFRRSGETADTNLTYDAGGNIASFDNGAAKFTVSWSNIVNGYIYPTYTIPGAGTITYDLQQKIWTGPAVAQVHIVNPLRRDAEQVDKDLSDT